MGSIGGLIGIGSSPGAQGLGFSAQATNVLNPVSNEQAQTAYGQSQEGIANQAAFLAALQGQNGIQNQSDVYNQLAGVANGTGPNPAQAALAQATGANVSNQAALMAGQRGAGANAGLIARQAALQGGNIQQQAAGQGAAMQAQQSLNAINSMGNLAGQQVANQAAATGALTGAQQSEQQTLLNSIQGQNNSNVAQQNAINNTNSTMAQAGAKAQTGLLNGIVGGLTMAKGGMVPRYADGGNVQNAEYVTAANSPPAQWGSLLGSQLPKPTVSVAAAPVAVQPTAAPPSPQAPQSFLHKAVSGVGGVDSSAGAQQDPLEKSGQQIGQNLGKGIKSLFSSSTPTPMTDAGFQMPEMGSQFSGGAGPSLGAVLKAHGGMMADGGVVGSDENGSNLSKILPIAMKLAPLLLARGGNVNDKPNAKVPAKVSPGEIYLNPKDVKKVAEGKESPMSGKKIPGKAKVKGDSYANDTVNANLDAGGIVIPRHITQGKDAAKKAGEFVASVLKRKALSRG